MFIGFGIFLYLTILMTIILFARGGAMADAERPGGGWAKYTWPLASAAIWALTIFILRWRSLLGLLPQIVLFFGITLWRSKESFHAEERQRQAIRRREEEREERYRRERERQQPPR